MAKMTPIPYDLSGMRILLTGAKGGIGEATARLCSQLGAELLLIDVGEAPEWLGELEVSVGQVHTYTHCDLSDLGQIDSLCGEQTTMVHALILNAGIYPVSTWDDDGWDDDFERVMQVNVGGALRLAHSMLPHMATDGRGRIVLLGSLAAHTGGSHAHSPLHYAASKGAIHSSVKWLARRLAPGILVNAIAPGATRTRMNDLARPETLLVQPVPRLADPGEIAWPIAFLCSPGASFMCGAVIDVNGGAYM